MRSRSKSRENRRNSPAIKQRVDKYIRDYDTKLFEEFRSTKGLSPENIKAREQRVSALKKVNNYVATIRE